MTDVGPDRNDPFPNRSFADIVTAVDEAPTGRFMVGVAASSFQGLFGNVTVYEKNFDIFNLPRSFNDIFNGTAFRGGGQEFRLDIQPGTNINRFQVSLREPYLFDLPIGAGVAATGSTVFIPTGTSGAAAAGSRWDASSARASTPMRRCASKTSTSTASERRRRRSTWRLPESRPWSRSGPAYGSTTATTRFRPPRVSTPSSPSSRAGAHSPGPSSTPRGGLTSPPAAARTGPASGSSPCGATSVSRLREFRSTRATSPVTSAAFAASSTAPSARTPWACRSAAS